MQFFEDIDKDKSDIEADGVKEIGYGEKCKEPAEGEEVRYGSDCQKVPDMKKLFIIFNPSELKLGQQVQINFKKIYNKSGLKINEENVTRTIKIYPELEIYKITPDEGENAASLKEMVVCTSNPLKVPDEKNFSERVKSNMTVGLWNWNQYETYRVTNMAVKGCLPGQFINTIHYGLVPEFQYQIDLNLVDDFGQRANKTVNFTSGKVESVDRRLVSLQKEYNVTSPERTKLSFAADNLEYVNLHICKVSPETMLRYIESRPSNTVVLSSLDCERVIDKRVDLEKKYWSRVYFQINLADYLSEPIGHYVVSLGHPDYRMVSQVWNKKNPTEQVGERIYNRTYVTVTQLAVQEKKVNLSDYNYGNSDKNIKINNAPQNLYWVSQFGSLNPVSDASVNLYQYANPARRYESVSGNIKFVETHRTGNDGVVLTPAIPDLAAVIVKKGNDSAIVAGNMDRLQWASPAQAAEYTYLYTDRPIYRPGQTVSIKGIYRLGYDANYEIFKEQKAEVQIRNSKYEVVAKKLLDINDYGTFTTDIVLDEQAPLGTYSISSGGRTAYFDVEEYVSAAFKVEAKSDKDEYVAGDNLKLDVSADYYFGVPVEGGTVEYSISSQDYYFDRYRDGYFQFGSGWYYDFDGYYGDKFILRGKTNLDNNGKAEISEQLDFGKFFKGDEGNKSKIFTAHITVKNKNGQSISTQKSFITHRGEIYTGVNLDKSFVGKDEKVSARIKTVDTQGKEVSQRNVLVEIKKVTWESYKRQEVDGNYYYRSEQKKESVQKFTVSTDGKGNASVEFNLNKEGEYEVNVGAEDSRGNTVSSRQMLYVYGTGSVAVRPSNNETLELATDKSQVDVGENVKVVIKSPYPRAKALVSLERGRIFSYEIIDVNGSFADYNFQIKDEHIPNVYASVLLLSPRPEIKFGQINYRVNIKQRDLDITIDSDKNNYLPGEKVNLEILVKDRNGNPVSSELSLAVVDMSVLALVGNPKKNPALFFYNGSPLTVSTESNIKNILYEADIPVGTKGGGGGAEELAAKKRGIFNDTAFWQGAVNTDASGKASISFTLPDNLTTWQAESVGVTKDTKLGVGYKEFKTQKDLMAIPLKPRFVIPGDKFYIGAQVFNNTDDRQKVKIDVSSKTLQFTDDKNISITLDSHSDETVYFPVTAPINIQDGNHVFEISAKSETLTDIVENSIKIARNDTYEAVATANYTKDKQSKEYVYLPPNIVADKGGLTIKSSVTLAVFLTDALNYLVQYPYGCSEQIASKLSSLAILKKSSGIKNFEKAFNVKEVEFEGRKYSPDDVVRIGLARLYENQTNEGGFAYYKNMQSDFYLTMHVLNTLIDLKDAGYSIDIDKINKATQYLSSYFLKNPQLAQSKDTVVLLAYTLSRPTGSLTDGTLYNRVVAIADDRQYINERASNESLAHLALLLLKNFPTVLKERVFKQLENRIAIDARGAYLSLQGREPFYQYYETPVKDTALMLKAFALDKRENPILDKVLRWLLASRTKDGAWGSTNNTVAAVDAMADFLIWKKESQSVFDLAVTLDNESVGENSFNKETILNTFEKFVPVSAIGLDKVKTILFSKTDKNAKGSGMLSFLETAPENNYYYDILLKYYLPVDKISPRDEGFSITREFYKTDDKENIAPIFEAKQGEVLRGHLTITVPKQRNLVSVEDFIPAGMEIVNLKLATEDQSLKNSGGKNRFNGGKGGYYEGPAGYNDRGGKSNATKLGLANIGSLISWGSEKELNDDAYGKKETRVSQLWPDSIESHDDRLFLFMQNLQPGVYEYDYFVRALIPGTYHHLPAIASEMYTPEIFGRTRGEFFEVKKMK